MRKKFRKMLVFGMIFVMLAAMIVIIVPDDVSAYRSRGKIIITANVGPNGFVAQGGASGGGTKGNPYILYNYEIDAGGAGSCISITGTDAFFKIIQCKLYNSGGMATDSGIKLIDVQNYLQINDTIIYNCEYGIYLDNSPGQTIKEYIGIHDNEIYNNGMDGLYILNCGEHKIYSNEIYNNGNNGIYLKDSDDNTINNNEIYGNDDNGIRMRDVDDNTIGPDNDIHENGYSGTYRNGIYMRYCLRNTIKENWIYNNEENGIKMYLCNDNNIYADRNTIKKNVITNNQDYGIYFDQSHNNIIQDHHYDYINGYSGIIGNWVGGIYFDDSNNNEIKNNYLYLNPDTSIHLFNCDGLIGPNTISGNEITTDHSPSIGIYLQTSDNHMVDSNWIYSTYTFKCIYLLASNGNDINLNTCNNLLPWHNPSYGIYLELSGGSSTNFIHGNSVTGNWEGIYLKESDFNDVYDNYIQQNNRGITLIQDCDNNDIYDNDIFYNTKYGTKIIGCGSNTIYNNNFIGNNGATPVYNPANIQAYDNGGLGANSWDAGSSVGGNYWNDWTSPDNNGDGYVDFPYLLD